MVFGTIVKDSGKSFDNYVYGKDTIISDKCKIEYFSNKINKINPFWYILILLLVVVLIIWFA